VRDDAVDVSLGDDGMVVFQSRIVPVKAGAAGVIHFDLNI
jgi:hypothetical protein